MYDVQYDAVAKGSNTNCISVFANHRGAKFMLKALVLIFIGFLLKKMCTLVS